MRKFRWLGLLGILCFVSSVIRGDSSNSALLKTEDRELEVSAYEEGRSALSSEVDAEEPWESYDEWRCFPNRSIKLTCTEIKYGRWRKSPVIVASYDGHRFEYDVDPTFRWNCEFTLSEWRRVIGNSSEVCLFGAYLQPLGGEASLWVLSRFKSENGYWIEYESESYRHAKLDLTEQEDQDGVEE